MLAHSQLKKMFVFSIYSPEILIALIKSALNNSGFWSQHTQFLYLNIWNFVYNWLYHVLLTFSMNSCLFMSINIFDLEK